MRLSKTEKETIRKWLKTTPKDIQLQNNIKEWGLIIWAIGTFWIIMFINFIM